jgi:flagellar hook assembly protein FlgD
MEQNYPNPMNPSTKIHFNLPIATRIALTIFNTLGQEIRTLVDAPRAAGKHILQWDGKDNDGKPAASGVYLYRLQAGSFSQTKRLTLLR